MQLQRAFFTTWLARFSSITAAFIICSCSSISVDEAVEIDENTDWLFVGGNAEKSNISKSTYDFRFPLSLYWEFDSDAGFSKNCLSAADAVLFASTLKGECYAIDISGGRSIGRIAFDGASYSTPLVTGNSVILTSTGTSNARIVRTSLRTGLIRWSRYVGFVESSPILYEKDIFLCSINGKAYRLSAETGTVIWSTRAKRNGNTHPQFFTGPTISEGRLYAGANNGSMYCFETRSGSQLWSYVTKGSIFSDASADSGRIYFGSDDRHFYCLDSAGKMIWKTNLETRFLAASTFFGDQVITAGTDGRVYSINKHDGKVKWTFRSKGPVSGTPLLHKDLIFFGSYDTKFYCISAVDGRLIWSQATEGRLRSSPVIWREYIFVAGDDKYIYCFANKVMKTEVR